MKGAFRTRGLVLHCTDFSETSQIVRVFTRDHGIVDVLAKGSRRPARASSSFPSPFDLGGWYDLNFRIRSTQLHLATESRLVEGFDHLRGNIGVWLEAVFALDLLRTLFSPGDPHPELLKESLQYLKLLGHGLGRRRLRNHFLQSLLGASGVLPKRSKAPLRSSFPPDWSVLAALVLHRCIESMPPPGTTLLAIGRENGVWCPPGRFHRKRCRPAGICSGRFSCITWSARPGR